MTGNKSSKFDNFLLLDVIARDLRIETKGGVGLVVAAR